MMVLENNEYVSWININDAIPAVPMWVYAIAELGGNLKTIQAFYNNGFVLDPWNIEWNIIKWIPKKNHNMKTYILYLTCFDCGNTDMVFEKDAKQWVCPHCKLRF